MNALTNNQSTSGSGSEPPAEVPTGTIPTRTINVEVPEPVYWHVRRCAIESQLSMKDYMAKFCQEAWPYPPEQSGNHPAATTGTAQHHTTASRNVSQ